MKGIEWGLLYNKHKNKLFNGEEVEKQIANLFLDDEVTKKKGIYKYILTNDNKHLNIRTFTESQKAQILQEMAQFVKCVANK